MWSTIMIQPCQFSSQWSPFFPSRSPPDVRRLWPGPVLRESILRHRRRSPTVPYPAGCRQARRHASSSLDGVCPCDIHTTSTAPTHSDKEQEDPTQVAQDQRKPQVRLAHVLVLTLQCPFCTEQVLTVSLQTLQGFKHAPCATAPVVIGSRWFQRSAFGEWSVQRKTHSRRLQWARGSIWHQQELSQERCPSTTFSRLRREPKQNNK